MMQQGFLKLSASLLASALILVGCGGGDNEPPKASVSTVTVVGDSIADSGTFGLKFTVQTGSAKIWPELVAEQYGSSLCPHYNASLAVAQAACTNYAVGGGRINHLTSPTTSLSILQQMKDRAAAGSFGANELVLIDGGGNDAADLIGAYLGATTPTGVTNFQNMLLTLLSPSSLAVLAQPNGSATAGVLYMQALADSFANGIATNVMAKGANKVVVLNMPPVVLTPRFQMVLASIAASSGTATRDAVASLADTWVQTFNSRLASNLSNNPKIVIVNFYQDFKNEVNTPAQYGLTNATTPVCPITGLDSSGLPSYDFTQCTVANIEAGKTPGWWTRYAFSDGFHPTPYGHQLVSQSVSLALAKAGWL